MTKDDDSSADKRPSRNGQIMKFPQRESFESVQLNLFQRFLSNTSEENDRLSNTIELWDAVPKYFVDRTEQNKLRHRTEQTLPVLQREFEHGSKAFRVAIYPARIETDDGFREYYPGVREELIEDALRKIAARQDQGFFTQTRSGCIFSLHGLRKELAARGHTMSYQQVYESLSILNAACVDLFGADRKRMFKASILPLLAGVDRAYLDMDPKAKWFCDFYPLVTYAMECLAYRQYDYERMMGHPSQLARWLHKRLAHNYVQASWQNPYHISFSTVQRDSGLLDYDSGNARAVKKLETACNELKNDKVLNFYTVQKKRGARGKVLDAVFELTPAPGFARNVKAANKRHSENLTILDPNKKR